MLRITHIILIVLATNLIGAKYIPDYDQDVNPEIEPHWDSEWYAQPGQFPHHAKLRIITRYGWPRVCSGALIDRGWVLTAAHCVADTTFSAFLNSAARATVRIGGITESASEYVAETREFHIHELYNTMFPTAQPNNIALLRLSPDVAFSPNLQAIRIQASSEANMEFSNVIVIVSGYRRRIPTGPIEKLHWLYLNGITNDACKRIYGTLVNDATLCASQDAVTMKSHCLDDEGAPLVYEGRNNATVLVGITSFLGTGPWPCGGGMPAESLKCAGCLNDIGDDEYISALGQDWHKDCFRCSVCDASLSTWYFEKAGLLFCQNDYWTRYGDNCQQCAQV
ncbi:Collagenase [Papilio machaon]|uniref:Collagenase n=1 Tax=Papilio machaon TaxID=76193 RepID=A0A194R1H6_PAPMA|nr:Collagenase [Papilio machaon]